MTCVHQYSITQSSVTALKIPCATPTPCATSTTPFPLAMNENCSTSLLAFGVVSILDFGYFNRYVVLSCCFSLHFPNEKWCGTSFHMLIRCLYILLGEVSVKVFDPFFNQVVLFFYCWVKSSLYILGNSPLSDVFFAYIFPHGLLFSFSWHCPSQSRSF